MRHIIYLTTAMDEYDFKEYVPHWSISLNPSNQNFHNKLIHTLALTNKVDVISIRPYSKRYCDIKKLAQEFKIEGNITWHYLCIKKYLVSKILHIEQQIKNLIKKRFSDEDEFLIFADTINLNIVHYTHFLKTLLKDKVKIVGVVTDSPSNISGVGRSYTTYVLNHSSNHDAYLSLTAELDDLYNKNKAPSVIIEGLVEDRGHLDPIVDENQKYFFFGGAMMQRYGVYELIDAFKMFIKEYPDYHLYLAGHHADKEKLTKAIKGNKKIHNLEMIPVGDVLRYEAYAVANINPRPFSEDLDRYSIPSKTLEYLMSGKPTISVKNSKLNKYFAEEIVWAKSSNAVDLKEAMEKVATAPKEINEELGQKGKEKALNNFSLKAVNKLIEDDLLKIIFKD